MKISKRTVLAASIAMAVSGSAYADLNDGLVLQIDGDEKTDVFIHR
ncbi:MAG: hypothetical protein GY862_12315 [Gammaproteobacteria bacterium]|nr:hypothetical protein [Gammaproteobacteria bacterium]